MDFELGVEVDDELAQECGEGDFGRLAFGEQVLVEVAQDGFGAAADQSGRIERLASGGLSSADRAFAAQRAAIAIQGSHAGQRRGGLAHEAPEFGQVSQPREWPR